MGGRNMLASGQHNTTKIALQHTLRGMLHLELAEDFQHNQTQHKFGREALQRKTP